jgi:citrate lyase beta subunit
MEYGAQPFRSVLYMPGSKPRALEKARGLAADALILDLEDAVLPTEKVRARDLVAEAVAGRGFGRRVVLVRVNELKSEWGAADIAAASGAGADGVLLPKVECADDILRANELMERAGAPESIRIWAMMETARAVIAAPEVASSHPRLAGFVMGTNDLAKELYAAHVPDRAPLITSLGICLLAARAEGLVAVDGVFNAFKDGQGFREACRQSRDLGFDGRSLIHPDQIAIANEVFAPSREDIEHAEAQVAAFEAASARGEGVAVLDGRIVENLHVDMARRLLARARAIADLADESAPNVMSIKGAAV